MSGDLDARAAELFNLVCNSSAAAVDSFLSSHHLHVDIQNDKGDTPLIMAARRGDIDVVKALINAGASVHSRNLKGSNPLIAVSSTSS
jgi:ankyrin repeat protein